MSTITSRLIFVFLAPLFLVAFTILSLSDQESAAPVLEANSNSCLSCHEDLYYLHDMGKYYCITEHKDRCAGCHEGNAAALKKEESHMGLIAHPQDNNGAKCQECHMPQDAGARLAEFASIGGFGTVIKANAYIPSDRFTSGYPKVPEANPLQENLPWVAGALVLFSLWLLLVHFSPLEP